MNPSPALNKLVYDLVELLAELSDKHGPEMNEQRNRAQAIGSAKRAIASQRTGVVARIGHYAGAVDDYIIEFPRLGFFTGVLVSGGIVYVRGLSSSKA